ncbi:hypothetical protein [Nostoc sp. ChiSLP03a]|uniref:hypothetical protein n=1 Tax=Nostoc sp. ChiSLP03a TaxID=3075380 RepID=UPI002AD2610C|nr:hypothetical protein [Nostoc sp. ChiSLP03a]MDZ8210069.1 hypothetical protein [Nostoc sp. ChiSLP03a]
MMQQSMPNKEIQTLSFLEELDETQLIGIVGGGDSAVGDTVGNVGSTAGTAGQFTTGLIIYTANGLGAIGRSVGGLLQGAAGNG